jgi:hypothetical protein
MALSGFPSLTIRLRETPALWDNGPLLSLTLPAMTTYYYVLASQKFLLEEEPFAEVLKERTRDYQEKNKEIDFWLVKQPAFLNAPELAEVKAKAPAQNVAVISTQKSFIVWLKLRLEYVLTGEFTAPSAEIPDPLASLEVPA